jgi:NAD(P)-dependent dehydrogenase (short-subunit alcohol dehydrogenase family)
MRPVALITGASKGLGLALAGTLADRGYDLVLNARGVDALDRAGHSLAAKTNVLLIPADVSEDAEGIAGRAFERFGRIDVLVNNASELGAFLAEDVPLAEVSAAPLATNGAALPTNGTGMPTLELHPWESLLRIYRVNVVAPIHLAQLVIPQMRARRSGVIINITSDAGVNAYPGWGGYGSSKAALEHASRILASELSGSGIRVLVVDPGDMNTEMHRQADPGVDLSHLARPETVAPAIAALLDEDTPFSRVEAQRMESMAS